MTTIASSDSTRFWAPNFTYETRADGSILMRQKGE